jgi:hypothetical protein
VRAAGLAATAIYAALIVWLYLTQPQTMAHVTGGLASSVGAYRADPQAFADGLDFFRRDRFVEARAAFARADPAERDALTQFYVAYAFYREGWTRTHRDDELYGRGLAAVDKAIALAPGGRLVVDDANLLMRSADELRAELERGLTTDASDFNPLRLFETRK